MPDATSNGAGRKGDLPELGALIDHAQLFIGVDSAPAHIAAAVNTPLISLFGATDHIFWRPRSNNMIQFWAGDYREMPTRDQRDRNEMYLSVIPAADVIAAVDKLLPPPRQVRRYDRCFCLYKYFPFGGLQRDFMRIAQTVAARGHHVRVYTQSWEGECPDVFELIKVPVKSHTNHGRNAEYFARVQNIYVNTRR